MKNKSLFLLLGGMAVGALIGILLAPDKGSATRQKLADKGKKLMDELKDKINEQKSSYQSSEEKANIMEE
jgi:gas vesicle protein